MSLLWNPLQYHVPYEPLVEPYSIPCLWVCCEASKYSNTANKGRLLGKAKIFLRGHAVLCPSEWQYIDTWCVVKHYHSNTTKFPSDE